MAWSKAKQMKFLSDAPVIRVATVSRNCKPLVTDEYKASWHDMGGVMVQGTAKIIRKGPIFLEIRKRLYKKFKVYESNAGFEEGESAIIEVTPKRRFSWWFK